MSDTTTKQDDVLMHTLGLRIDDDGDSYRNHYVTGSEPCAEILALVAGGLMEETRRPEFLNVNDRNYRVTDLGKARALSARSRRRPKLTRGQKRYRDWLAISDAYPDLTFGKFLRMGGLESWRRSWAIIP